MQANLQAVGFNVDLGRLDRRDVAAEVPRREDGVRALALGPGLSRIRRTTWRSRPASSSGFAPAGPQGSDPALEKLAAKALVTTASKARATIYQQIQIALNQRGPFIPLLQPTQVFVSTTDLKNAVFNPEYQIDVTQVSAK